MTATSCCRRPTGWPIRGGHAADHSTTGSGSPRTPRRSPPQWSSSSPSGALRLDDRVGSWLTDLAGTPVGDVLLRELLAHGGGVVRDGWDGDFWQLARTFPDARRCSGSPPTTPRSSPATSDSSTPTSATPCSAWSSRRSPAGRSATTSARRSSAPSASTTPRPTSIRPRRRPRHRVRQPRLRRPPAAHRSHRHRRDGVGHGFSSTATDLVRYAAAHFHGDMRL